MTIHHRSYRGWAGAGSVGLAAALGFLLFATSPAHAAEPPVNLGTAANFSVLAGSAVTNTGATTLAQGLGVHPGAAASGFPPGTVAGEIHLADGVALQAKSDLTTAYLDAAGRTPFTNLPAELGGLTLNPGVYRIGAAQLTGALTLNSQFDPAAVFIFQVASSLITASNSDVGFINGASPCNVFWQVGSSATLGTNSDFIGNIMALTSITLNTGATLSGRALARNGAVTLDDNVITTPFCSTATTPPTTAPTATTPATPGATTPATPGATTPAVPGATTPAAPGATTSASPGVVPGNPVVTTTADAPGTPPVSTLPPSSGGPPRLPLTGPGLVPVLSVTGIGLIVLGLGIVLWFRRPETGS